jgi:hypothetical protein
MLKHGSPSDVSILAMRWPARTARALLALTLAGGGVAAYAGPLQLERVDAQCTWLVHADLDSMRASAAGREMLRIASAQVEELFEPMRTKLGVDLSSEVRGLTIYGPSLRERAGVTLLDIEPGADLSEVAKLGTADGKAGEGTRTLRVIDDESGQRWFVAERVRDTRTVLVVGDDELAVLRAVDVLEGRRGSMRTSVVLSMLGSQLATVDGAALQSPAPKWPFDQLPTLMHDRVMLTLAVAEVPQPREAGAHEAAAPRDGEPAATQSQSVPTIARVEGLLARLGEIRDETSASWVEADLQVRMLDEASAVDMRSLMLRVLSMLAPRDEATPPGQCPPGIELAQAGSTVHLRAKERLEEAVAGLQGGGTEKRFSLLRVLRPQPEASEPRENDPKNKGY